MRCDVIGLGRMHDAVEIRKLDALFRQTPHKGVLQDVAAVLVFEHNDQHVIERAFSVQPIVCLGNPHR